MAIDSRPSMTNSPTSEAPRSGVLVVDDDELLLSSINRLLRPVRRPVLTAADAGRAAALLTENDVGVIVCEPRDLRLAAFLIEARERHPAAVRVILTGYPDLTSVVKAVNEANPFMLLTKPWLDDDLVATVKLAFEQYAVNRKRDRLIDEYAGIRANAERAHGFHVLDALMSSIHPAINDEAVADLPVGVLLLREGAVAAVNGAACRFLANLGLPAPKVGSTAATLPPPLATLLAAAPAAPRRQRMSHPVSDRDRLAFFVLDIAAGTLIVFVPAPQGGHGPR